MTFDEHVAGLRVLRDELGKNACDLLSIMEKMKPSDPGYHVVMAQQSVAFMLWVQIAKMVKSKAN